mmetsp:Transcript_25509/g.84007  ORF Transcript_25509/g.84007 Transcript_25509/m.84007 type:complete len:236 (-) Transcript_25509:262-969(-)
MLLLQIKYDDALPHCLSHQWTDVPARFPARFPAPFPPVRLPCAPLCLPAALVAAAACSRVAPPVPTKGCSPTHASSFTPNRAALSAACARLRSVTRPSRRSAPAMRSCSVSERCACAGSSSAAVTREEDEEADPRPPAPVVPGATTSGPMPLETGVEAAAEARSAAERRGRGRACGSALRRLAACAFSRSAASAASFRSCAILRFSASSTSSRSCSSMRWLLSSSSAARRSSSSA